MQQLLHHTGGWDRDKSFDPMFRSRQISGVEDKTTRGTARTIIRYMLRQPLQFGAGDAMPTRTSVTACWAGLIEKASGQGYEEYVRKEVLAPLGIKRMRIGHTLLKDRAPGEVRYYTAKDRTVPAILGPDLGKPVPVPYGGWYLEAMDSHGAWIASAGDLVRFAAAFNDPAKCKILNAKSIALMFAPPSGKVGHRPDGKPKEEFYACGWDIAMLKDGKFNSFHSGSLDGTSTLLVRRSDNLTWAVLFNSRGSGGKNEPSERHRRAASQGGERSENVAEEVGSASPQRKARTSGTAGNCPARPCCALRARRLSCLPLCTSLERSDTINRCFSALSNARGMILAFKRKA